MIKTRIYRIGRLGCGALVLSLAPQAAVAQTAYFALQGEINAAGDQYDFTFDLTRSVTGTETLFFETHTDEGGTNAAGDIIPLTGFDSDIRLFNSGGVQIAHDDQSGPNLDSLITWAVNQPFGTPLPDPLPIDSYRLNMRDFGNNSIGVFAVDLIAPDDAITFTGGTPLNTGTLNSLKFGSNDGGTATFNYNSAGLFALTGELVVAQTGNAVLNQSNGSIDVATSAPANVSSHLNARHRARRMIMAKTSISSVRGLY